MWVRTRIVVKIPALVWLGIRDLDHEALSAPANLHASLCTPTSLGHGLFLDLRPGKTVPPHRLDFAT